MFCFIVYLISISSLRFLRQRKTEVRRNKLRHLLKPAHFIRYGRSKHVQNIITTIKKYQNDGKSVRKITKPFAMQIRDYLIANLVIANGLRSSNILNLRLRDFEECKSIEEYPGHKIITNDIYKTSSIYGEKFIVMSQQLYEHCQFYIQHLRKIATNVKSSRVFLAASGQSKMTQTNVTSSITATFKAAYVLSPTEYQRVSCTRIRCAIATFACNEGDFDMAFFARNFMKNKEETTARHYNLLSNQIHAASIAMKLYDTFTGPDGVDFSDDSTTVDSVSEMLQKSTEFVKKEKVLAWLRKTNPDISKSEMEEICSYLEEASSPPNARTFYRQQVFIKFLNNELICFPIKLFLH